ncbi:hypothetical protein HA466_0226240 [Hirschfeldia incana]|nr:hypothetical protein HA466_0226240 [Hirschfeldia incana]
MISLLFPQSPLCTVAIVFYTYVCLPLGKLKKQCGEARSHYDDDDGYNLTSVMFRDKEKKKGAEICCSICLMDYEDEDAVTHLPRCNHLFHVHCIEPWLLRGSLTCPLCRSFVFSPTPSPQTNSNDSQFKSADMVYQGEDGYKCAHSNIELLTLV